MKMCTPLMVLPRRLTWRSDLLQLFVRQRHYWRNMDSSLLEPPAAVRGMRELERDAFRKRVQLPRLRVREEQANKVLPLLKKMLLKMERLRPVHVLESKAAKEARPAHREIFLHPLAVKSWESLPTTELEQLQVNAADFYYDELELCYDNWRADEILKSVLPADEEGLTSYSRIGHIVHLNLRDHLLPYKQLIGQVLCDKVAGCRTVVNKAQTIDNTYRNFQLELICGVEEYQVETKENGITFEFDFSRVYWNPRLSTEHERIVQVLQAGDVLYDVFAGVGPFSVPAAKKRCWVLANDLNPDSYRWLQHNAKRNKCLAHMQTFNLDGRDFIEQHVKADLLRRWREKPAVEQGEYNIHITMNLPAMAVEFLNAFRGLFQQEAAELKFEQAHFNYPTVHVYSFAKGEGTKALVRTLVEQHLGVPLADNLVGVHFVRNVAPNKDMYRVSFRLTEQILTTPFDAQFAAETVEQATRKRAAAEDGALHTAKVKCS